MSDALMCNSYINTTTKQHIKKDELFPPNNSHTVLVFSAGIM